MPQVIGTPLVTDLAEAMRLPIVNLPAGQNTIRLKQTRAGRPVKFFVRTIIDAGSIVRAYAATNECGRLKLIQIAGANARRKPA